MDDDPPSDGVDGPGQVPASGQDDAGDHVDADGGDDDTHDFRGNGEKTAEVSGNHDHDPGEEAEPKEAEEESEGEDGAATDQLEVWRRNGDLEWSLGRKTSVFFFI